MRPMQCNQAKQSSSAWAPLQRKMAKPTSLPSTMWRVCSPPRLTLQNCSSRKARCPPAKSPELVVTTINSAELIKHASNSFLALKISYANMIADLCEKVGADIKEVVRAMGLYPRIGPQFLNAGLGFGGFCLPKDVQAFVRLAERSGVNFGMLK